VVDPGVGDVGVYFGGEVVVDGRAVLDGLEAGGGVGFVGDRHRGEGDARVVAQVRVRHEVALGIGDRLGVGVADGEGVEDGGAQRLALHAYVAHERGDALVGVGRADEGVSSPPLHPGAQGGPGMVVELGDLGVGVEGGEGVVGDLPSDAQGSFDGDAQEPEGLVGEDLALVTDPWV